MTLVLESNKSIDNKHCDEGINPTSQGCNLPEWGIDLGEGLNAPKIKQNLDGVKITNRKGEEVFLKGRQLKGKNSKPTKATSENKQKNNPSEKYHCQANLADTSQVDQSDLQINKMKHDSSPEIKTGYPPVLSGAIESEFSSIKEKIEDEIEEKISRPASSFRILTDIVLGIDSAVAYPSFKTKYHFKNSQTGHRIIFKEIDEKILIPSSLDDLKKTILRYSYENFDALEIEPSTSVATKVSTLVEAIAPVFYEEIAPVRFKSEKGYTFQRLNFDPVTCNNLTKAPHWENLISRMGANGNAFCMRIGSLFDSKADRKQSIYIYDVHGDTGKSQIVAILQRVFGPAFMTLSNEDLRSNFWRTTLVGKRVLAVNEATIRFLKGDAFKSLIGDSDHSVQQKNKPISKTKLDVLVFFFSNTPPQLPNDQPILNRIIAINLQPFKGELIPETDYQKLLEGELPHFIGYCLELYKPLFGGRRIPCCQELLQDLAESDDADALDFFERYFISDPEAKFSPTELRELFTKNRIPTQRQKLWIEAWKRKYNIQHKRSKGVIGKRGPYFYYGMKLQDPLSSDP